MNDDQIKYMVDRFLEWRLPENFNPDGGISFKKAINENHPSWPQKNEPVGTNLLDATQAEEMVRYMVEGMEAGSESAPQGTASPTPKEQLYRFRRYNAYGVLMAEGVRVHAPDEDSARTKAKSLYSPWDGRERLELVEIIESQLRPPKCMCDLGYGTACTIHGNPNQVKVKPVGESRSEAPNNELEASDDRGNPFPCTSGMAPDVVGSAPRQYDARQIDPSRYMTYGQPTDVPDDDTEVTCLNCMGSGISIEGWDCEGCDGLGYLEF